MKKNSFSVPKKQKPGNNKGMRNFGFIILLTLIALAVMTTFNQPNQLKEVPFSEVVKNANAGKYEKIVVSGNGNELKVTEKGKSDPTLVSYKESSATLKDEGIKDGAVTVEVKKKTEGSVWSTLLLSLLPVILIGGLLIFMMRSAQGQGNQALSFGKSRARLYGNEKNKVTFTDIAGSDEAKQDLQEVVEFLKFPKKFDAVGARIPKGVLLVGPPGTGKTMLSRAVAGEADVPFFSISGSEFVEMFVGVGASRVRDLFAKAKKNAPCIIFIDEIDAVGRRRGSGMGGGHDEREQTLNQILVEMDGFEQGQNVIVIAATNRADVLDPALLRPGRFDRRVNIGLPERKDREAILKVHFKKKPVSKSVDLDALAAKSAGSSGADLQNIANESAIIAARHNRKEITQADVTEAFERVAIGPERKSKVMSDKEKELTAYHEAGHAIVGHVLPDSDPIHKVTIIPRGSTGGVTWSIPAEDKSYHSIVEFKDILARALGGRVAEEIIYGKDHVTTGAGSDLPSAASLARDMIINQGMGSDKLRNQVFHVESGMMFDRMTHEKDYSEETARLIDSEIRDLITEARDRAYAVLDANKKYLEALKDLLLEKETIDADDVSTALKGATMPKAAALY